MFLYLRRARGFLEAIDRAISGPTPTPVLVGAEERNPFSLLVDVATAAGARCILSDVGHQLELSLRLRSCDAMRAVFLGVFQPSAAANIRDQPAKSWEVRA